jgi:hypothetical protein
LLTGSPLLHRNFLKKGEASTEKEYSPTKTQAACGWHEASEPIKAIV